MEKMMRSEMNMVSGGRKKMMKSKVFAETCNKMRQFLKERRSLGDQFAFHNIPPPSSSSSMLEINGVVKEMCAPTNTTMNLFSKKIEKEGNVSTGQNLKSLDLFPLLSSSSIVTTEESPQNVADNYRKFATTKEEAKTTTTCMTIFYGGRVVVFDDLPEDKAHEIMTLASSRVINSCSQTQTPSNNTVITGRPMPRRLSLHRFWEKRKDRIVTSAPYPLSDMFTKNHEKYNFMRNVHQRQDQQLELKLF